MLMIDEQRAARAYTDVLTVEWDDDAGVARIITLSDCYTAIPSERMHLCPDRDHNLGDGEICKHLAALEITRGKIDAPSGWLVVEDVDERTDPEFQIERPPRIGKNRTFAAYQEDTQA